MFQLILRLTNVQASKEFYQNTIGFPILIDTQDLFAFPVGGVFIVFKKADDNWLIG